VDRDQIAKEFAEAVAQLPADWDLGSHLDKLVEELPPSFRAGLVRAEPVSGPEREAGVLAHFRVPDQLHDSRWELSGFVAMQGDRLVIAEMTLRAHPGWPHLPTAGIDRKVLSQVKTSEILKGVKWALSDFSRRVAIDHSQSRVSGAFRAFVEQTAATARNEVVPGRKGHDPALYRQLALRYLDLQDELQSSRATARGIIGKLAEEPWPSDIARGITTVEQNTVKSRLRKCRELGYLTFKGNGVAGATKGPKMIEEEQNEEES
jgi:hypothetical protein